MHSREAEDVRPVEDRKGLGRIYFTIVFSTVQEKVVHQLIQHTCRSQTWFFLESDQLFDRLRSLTTYIQAHTCNQSTYSQHHKEP